MTLKPLQGMAFHECGDLPKRTLRREDCVRQACVKQDRIRRSCVEKIASGGMASGIGHRGRQSVSVRVHRTEAHRSGSSDRTHRTELIEQSSSNRLIGQDSSDRTHRTQGIPWAVLECVCSDGFGRLLGASPRKIASGSAVNAKCSLPLPAFITRGADMRLYHFQIDIKHKHFRAAFPMTPSRSSRTLVRELLDGALG